MARGFAKKVVEEWDQLVSEDSAARSGRGVYGISVAAELSGVGQQSLRLYEERGLLTPARTAGGTRRYSDDDLVRLQRITDLLAAGVNVAGIGQILELQDRNTQLEFDKTALESDNVRLASAQRRAEAQNGPARRNHAREGRRS
ncbi:MAG: MerR family transcriptional regulator, heat shock protein HspR [Mycobacterium sp.]|nr:MerR family transcriptional regulator, heat shock protein HspR [Mycobacterium sp.]